MQVSAGDFRELVRWFQVNAGECRWLQVSAGEFNFYTLRLEHSCLIDCMWQLITSRSFMH